MDFTEKQLHQIQKEYQEVLQKYHPDLLTEKPFEKQKVMPAFVTRYYQVRIRHLENEKDKTLSRTNLPARKQPKNKVRLMKNQSYAYFRLGVDFYRQIQPSRWIYLESIEDFFFNDDRVTTFDEQKKMFSRIFINFQKSLQYFMAVISEYPDCPWVEDSKSKILYLGRLLQRYRKIRESIEKEMN
ncbi:MAG: hypothetical protein JXR70_08300 [Spirochaetales bacterium]|nr:hypothetical protein [Spirochaetales bacterium]